MAQGCANDMLPAFVVAQPCACRFEVKVANRSSLGYPKGISMRKAWESGNLLGEPETASKKWRLLKSQCDHQQFHDLQLWSVAIEVWKASESNRLSRVWWLQQNAGGHQTSAVPLQKMRYYMFVLRSWNPSRARRKTWPSPAFVPQNQGKLWVYDHHQLSLFL